MGNLSADQEESWGAPGQERPNPSLGELAVTFILLLILV